jgi:esterase/lipase superfamily enzyme
MLQDMQRQYTKWHSPSLHREIELLALQPVFPTLGGRNFE